MLVGELVLCSMHDPRHYRNAAGRIRTSAENDALFYFRSDVWEVKQNA